MFELPVKAKEVVVGNGVKLCSIKYGGMKHLQNSYIGKKFDIYF
jgi:hypothetical protein